jgi:drug/metabolite transporter (DMT)-like permease
MNWLTYTLLASLCWTGHLTAIKFIGDKLHPALTTATYYIVAFAVSVGFYFFTSKEKLGEQSLITDYKMIGAIICAGTALGLTNYFFVTAISKNAPLSMGFPIYSATCILLAALVGVAFFSESITFVKLAGFALIITGSFLIVK